MYIQIISVVDFLMSTSGSNRPRPGNLSFKGHLNH